MSILNAKKVLLEFAEMFDKGGTFEHRENAEMYVEAFNWAVDEKRFKVTDLDGAWGIDRIET
jgi:hypothetical protein